MNGSELVGIANIGATVVAVIAAPIVALYVGGRLQRVADARAAKVRLFNTLIGLRHDHFTPESVQALNSIDAIFIDDSEVREIWSQLLGLLNDPNAQNPAGWAMRDSKRRELLLAMVKALGWQRKLSTADIMRVYQPQFYSEDISLKMIERAVRRKELEDRAAELNIDISPFRVQMPMPPAPVKTATEVHSASPRPSLPISLRRLLKRDRNA